MKHLIALPLLLLVACATPKKQIMSLGLVSTTDRPYAASSELKDVRPVQVQYCSGEKSVTGDGAEIGIMDELVKRAQNETGARYIRNSQFYMQGACFSLEGVAAN